MATEHLDSELRRDQIAQAVLDLVADHGLVNLSVAAVARRVGLVPSALYRHFKDKDEVIDAALALIQEKLAGNVEAVRRQALDPLAQLERLLARHVRLIRENRGIPQIVFSQDLYSGRSERRRRVYRGIERYVAGVEEIIREGQRLGSVHANLDARVAAVMFLGLVQPSAILWHLSEGRFDVTRQAQRAWPLFCSLLRHGTCDRANAAASEGGSVEAKGGKQ